MTCADRLLELHFLAKNPDTEGMVLVHAADWYHARELVLNALPEIAAVVAAAETYSRNEYPNPCDECQHTGCVMARAVADLNRVLGDKP